MTIRINEWMKRNKQWTQRKKSFTCLVCTQHWVPMLYAGSKSKDLNDNTAPKIKTVLSYIGISFAEDIQNWLD